MCVTCTIHTTCTINYTFGDSLEHQYFSFHPLSLFPRTNQSNFPYELSSSLLLMLLLLLFLQFISTNLTYDCAYKLNCKRILRNVHKHTYIARQRNWKKYILEFMSSEMCSILCECILRRPGTPATATPEQKG